MNFAPEPIGIGRYTDELAAYLAGQGENIEVVTSLPHYPAWTIRPPYRPSIADADERVWAGRNELVALWRSRLVPERLPNPVEDEEVLLAMRRAHWALDFPDAGRTAAEGGRQLFRGLIRNEPGDRWLAEMLSKQAGVGIQTIMRFEAVEGIPPSGLQPLNSGRDTYADAPTRILPNVRR